jgi:choline dehydrogenase
MPIIAKQEGLGDRAIAYPRGKVMGGCSSINGMIYQRGQQQDYDGWAKTCGPQWSWDAVGPLFGKSRQTETNPTGEWKIVNQRLSWEVLDVFAKAAGELGIPYNPSFDNSDSESVGYGARFSTGIYTRGCH